MGFRALRVINEDRVAPGGGFRTHGHRDMEIITYVLDGALAHKDSHRHRLDDPAGRRAAHERGHRRPAQRVQRLEAEPVHFLQIWILPDARPAPSYEQKAFARSSTGTLRLVASPDGRDGSVTIHQDADLYAGGSRRARRSSTRRAGPLRVGPGRARQVEANGVTTG